MTEEEIQQLLQQTEGLALLKGKWVEVDHGRLRELLALLKRQRGDMTLLEALCESLSGRADEDSRERDPVVTNGAWLSQLLRSLRNPAKLRKVALPESFRGSLRPYQKNGLSVFCRICAWSFCMVLLL